MNLKKRREDYEISDLQFVWRICFQNVFVCQNLCAYVCAGGDVDDVKVLVLRHAWLSFRDTGWLK